METSRGHEGLAYKSLDTWNASPKIHALALVDLLEHLEPASQATTSGGPKRCGYFCPTKFVKTVQKSKNDLNLYYIHVIKDEILMKKKTPKGPKVWISPKFPALALVASGVL